MKTLEQVPVSNRDGDYLLMKARILDAAGQGKQAGHLLDQALQHSAARPRVAEEGALLLFRQNRKEDALKLLDRSARTNPDRAGLLLTRAIMLGVLGQTAAAEKALTQIESRWPEWGRAYVIHGILLANGPRQAEARRKIQTAAALGATDAAVPCVQARLDGTSRTDANCCGCYEGLEQFLSPGCNLPCAEAAQK